MNRVLTIYRGAPKAQGSLGKQRDECAASEEVAPRGSGRRMLKDTCKYIICWISNKRVLLTIITIAFLMRLFLAATFPYIWVEENEYIPLAESISLRGESLNLPIRGWHHPALPGYFIKAGGFLFGKNPIGFRFFGIIAGILMIVVASRLSDIWAGPIAARWTAVLLAFNEYHIGVSALAVDIIYYYTFAMLALYFFCRFLQKESPGYLYASSIMIGFAFLCREIIIIFLPVFVMCLLSSRYRSWFKRKEPYLAFFVFFLIISPDLCWNVTTKENNQVRLIDHLSRIGGLGFTPNYLLFYARDIFRRFGWQYFLDGYAEFPTMNMVFGAIFIGCVIRETLRIKWEDPVRNLMLLTFWVILVFFMLIRPGMNMSRRLDDNFGWLWIDLTLLPAILLTGSCVASLEKNWKTLAYIAISAGILYAIVRVLTAQFIDPNVWEKF